MDKDVRDAIYYVTVLADRAYWGAGSGGITEAKPKRCKGFDETYCQECEHVDYCDQRQRIEKLLVESAQ